MINLNKKNTIIIISISIILLIALLYNLSNNNLLNLNLKKNTKQAFSVDDLVIDSMKFGSTEDEIKKKFGKPKNTEIERKNSFKYKVFKYKKLKLTLRENYSDYILIGAEIESSKYNTSRDIKVGDKAIDVIKKYQISNNKGSYIYGNYKLSSLTNKNVTDNIYLGVRTNKQIMYVNRDKIVDNPFVNTAQIIYNYKNGKVTKIKWSYDFN